MAGHSKWANIRIKKGKMDAIRGKAFTKLAKDIISAAKAGGGDPDNNIRLRNAIAKAKAASMPADNIKRSLQRGTGEIDGAQYEEFSYEGYGPGGVAVMVYCMSDNKNRTAPEVRATFRACGGNLGENGCVSYLFDKKGQIIIRKTSELDEDTLMMSALEVGAEDVKSEDSETIEVITAPADVYSVKESIEAAGYEVEDAEAIMIPQNQITVTGNDAKQMLKMLDTFEENDDIQNVYTNMDISEEDMELYS